MAGTKRQKEAICRHDRSLVVSAGAGTGKTFVLVNKYINLLETFGQNKAGSKDQLSVLQILALTFTDKAAAEMKERIRSEIEKREGDFWEKTRLEFLIAPVETFHSFCASVLREFAFDAGLHPSFAVLDNRELTTILSLAFQELIHTPAEGETADALVFLLSLVRPADLEEMIRYLYQKRDDADYLFVALNADPTGLVAHWQEEIARFWEERMRNLQNNPEFNFLAHSLISFSYMDVSADDKAMRYLQTVRPAVEKMRDARTVPLFFEALSFFLSEKLGNSGSKKNWSEDTLALLKETNKKLRDNVENLKFLSEMELSSDDPFTILTLRFLQALGLVSSRYGAIVDEKKSEAGGLDFFDLIRYTRNLFQKRRDLVGSYYRKRFRYILIDEFQDTDPAQFDIISAIIGDPSPDLDNLFIVGDPKQSIYLFRDADVTRFRDATLFITESCKGEEIPLDVCFRSSPAVVTFVNYLFSHLFASVEKPWEFRYDPIRVSDERVSHISSVSLMLIRKDAGITEYDAVADRIEEMIAAKTGVYVEGSRDSSGERTYTTRPAAYGDIAILLERRTHIGSFIHALATRNIPYYVYKGIGMYERQEILDLITLLSFLYRPYDDIHLVGLLRSPYVGFSDRDILIISRQQGDSFFQKLQDSVSLSAEYNRIYALLQQWQKKAGRLSLVSLIRSVLSESGILAVYGGLIEGGQILGNIEKLLDIIRAREERGRYYLSDLVADLHDALEREEEEGEAMIEDPDRNAVIIMTVHAAKGLEYPIVFVPGMADRPRSNQGSILLDTARNLIGVRIPSPHKDYDSSETPIYTLLREEMNEKQLAEKRRLLYVALTRSADHLVMSGTIKESGKDLPDGSGQTRLDWILPVLGITKDTLECKTIMVKTNDRDEVGVHISIPVHVERETKLKPNPESIPDAFYTCHGKFVRTMYPGSLPKTTLIPVTRLAGVLPYEKSDTTNRNGRGAHFGSAVHEVMRGKEPKRIIRQFDIRDAEEQAILFSVSDDLWNLSLLSGVSQVYREFAFCVNIDGIPLQGRMDLLVRLADGTWMVIDYKSENISADILVRDESYQFQVEIYRRAAEIAGMKPVRGALYCVHEKRLVDFPLWNDAELFRVLRIRKEKLENCSGFL